MPLPSITPSHPTYDKYVSNMGIDLHNAVDMLTMIGKRKAATILRKAMKDIIAAYPDLAEPLKKQRTR